MEITRKRVYIPVWRESWNLLDIILSLLPKAKAVTESRVHYSGEFGNTTQDMKPYDSLTTAEHDAIGAFFGGHYV